MMQIIEHVANEYDLKTAHVHSVIKLIFEEDCTVPFVARYRKEMTGSMDEVKIRDVRDRFSYLQDLEASKDKYLKVVAEHCQKNPAYKGRYEELEKKFRACKTRQELDDLYLPFKPKRRTRAMIAKEKGLEPLLTKILQERATLADPLTAAAAFVTAADAKVDDDKRVASAEDALAGAADIFAEQINETPEWRQLVRRMSEESGQLTAKKIEPKASAAAAAEESKGKITKKKKPDTEKYANYFEYSEPLLTAPSHRVMAVRRGEAEKVLRVGVAVDEPRIHDELKSSVLGEHVATDGVKTWMETVTEDAYRRLLAPSIETELRLLVKNRAEEEAIRVFSKNLEKLLLLPPIPNRIVLGVDPGLRTGSKLAVIDETGKLLAHATIYPDYRKDESPKNKDAKGIIAKFVKEHNVTCVAVGNGTGSREVDQFITAAVKEQNLPSLQRVVVNEAGASVYSTEDIAREEFPDLDPTIRSAISIARRLQDPLAELVKINPRSIGVGQYQHDVNPTKLTSSLSEVVESCVNKVGVNLNTASYKLLGYVSGIGPSIARGIVEHRNKGGQFKCRADLMTVSGLGPKAYQQAAGFIRVPESENPLDNSAVHPERYDIIENVAKDLGKPLGDLIGDRTTVDRIPWEKYVNEAVGMPTLRDIAEELVKPGRDPREDGARLLFSDTVSEISDLKNGMSLQGTVTNVTNFGAFVDIGVHQDGLVHVSELADKFVKDPAEVVAVGDILNVKVIDVDAGRKRISLSCRTQSREDGQRSGGAAKSSGGRPERGGGEARGGRGPNRPAGGRSGGGKPQRGGGRGKQDSGPPATLADLMNKFNK